MKIGFNTYDLTVNTYKTDLTVEEAGSIVIAFAEKKDVSTARADLFLPKSVIEATYKDIQEIEAMVLRIMKGEAIMIFAEYDTETDEEITPIGYNTIPTTIDDLKIISFELIARDYSAKVQGNYTIEQVEDLRSKVYFCIDTLISYSKSTKDGDWTFFSQQF